MPGTDRLVFTVNVLNSPEDIGDAALPTSVHPTILPASMSTVGKLAVPDIQRSFHLCPERPKSIAPDLCAHSLPAG